MVTWIMEWQMWSGNMPVGNVAVLSESEGEGCNLIPEPPPVARPSRKRSLKSHGQAIDSEKCLRKILGRRCRCKKKDVFGCLHRTVILRNCKNTGKSVNMHKLDQDHLHLISSFGIWLWFCFDLVLGGSSQSVGLKTTGFDAIRYCTRSETLCSNRQTMYPYVGTSSGGKFAESKIHWTDPIELTPMFFILAFWWLPTGLPW